MNAGLLLALQREEESWTKLVWVLIFLLPVLGRILRALLEKIGLIQAQPRAPSEEERAEAPTRAEEERAEELRRRAEGEEMWRRLLKGDEASPPAAPRPAPPPPPSIGPRSSESQPRIPPVGDPPRGDELVGDEAGEPLPLSVLGEVREPGEAAEVSVEAAGEPEPLAALSRAESAPSFVARRRLALAPRDLRQAMVLAEVLGPPLALRRGHRRDPP